MTKSERHFGYVASLGSARIRLLAGCPPLETLPTEVLRLTQKVVVAMELG